MTSKPKTMAELAKLPAGHPELKALHAEWNYGRPCDADAEICISVRARSPREASRAFEACIEKGFGDREYSLSEDRIFIEDKQTGIPQNWESEEFGLEG